MEYEYNDKLAFFSEWYDSESYCRKKFLLNYFPSDNSLCLFDLTTNKTYLKRTKMDNLEMKDMFLGNIVRIYGRQIKITEYADENTRKIVGKTQEHTFTIIKPDLVSKLGEVITEMQRNGFYISNMKMCNLTRKESLDLHEPYKGDAFLPFILEHLVSGPIVAVELVRENAIQHWLKVLGPDDPLEARTSSPESLRAIYGKDKVTNGFHASEDLNNAIREANFFFLKAKHGQVPKSSCMFKNATCCIIKPHAIKEGKLGYIISAINESHFKITALEMIYLSHTNAEEFLEVYNGIISDFNALVNSFIDGPCVALEISGKIHDMNVYEEFRKFCGPTDSDIARQIRPSTLRARFGCDKFKNAVHCTDLNDDTVLELEYLFKILNN